MDVNEVFGREDALRRAWADLNAGHNLLLDEPRRFGKTSFLELLVAERATGWAAKKLSLQGRSRSEEVAVALLEAVRSASGTRKGLMETVAPYLKSVNAGPVTLATGFSERPLDTLDRAMRAINARLEADQTRLLLALDEFTECVREIGRREGAESARSLLGTMRRLREECPHIRWVLTGSIGFHHVLREIGATAQVINNTKVFALGPLDSAWAEWLGECVLLGSNAAVHDPTVYAELASVADGIPMLIHLVAEMLSDEPRGPLNPDDIEGLLDECFRRSDRSANLTHLLTRLNDYYGDRTEQASELLDAASGGETVGPKDREGRELVDLLVDDHYLVREPGGRVRWKYPSLCRLWRIRRGLD